MAVIAGLLASIVAVQRAGDARQRAKALARAKQIQEALPATIQMRIWNIGRALLAYGGVGEFDQYPKDRPWPPQVPTDELGKPAGSWRLPISQFIADGRYPIPAPEVNEPWNSPANLTYAAEMGEWFNLTITRSPNDSTTHLFGIAGPDAAFDGSTASRYADLPNELIVAMEIRDSRKQCMQPGDYDVTELLAYTGRIGEHLHGLLPDRLHVLFADGEVWALSPDAPMTALHPFLTIAGAESHDRDKLLAPHRAR